MEREKIELLKNSNTDTSKRGQEPPKGSGKELAKLYSNYKNNPTAYKRGQGTITGSERKDRQSEGHYRIDQQGAGEENKKNIQYQVQFAFVALSISVGHRKESLIA